MAIDIAAFRTLWLDIDCCFPAMVRSAGDRCCVALIATRCLLIFSLPDLSGCLESIEFSRVFPAPFLFLVSRVERQLANEARRGGLARSRSAGDEGGIGTRERGCRGAGAGVPERRRMTLAAEPGTLRAQVYEDSLAGDGASQGEGTATENPRGRDRTS